MVSLPIIETHAWNTGDVCERRSGDVASAVDVRGKDRHPDCESPHDCVCGGFVAPGVHDVQLADADESGKRRLAWLGGESVAHDFAGVFLVDGLRFAWIRQLVVRAREALRELGYGGVVGTVAALVCAYVMYPAFLDWAGPKETKMVAEETGSRFWERKFVWASLATVLVSAGLSFGLTRLNTDPSLLDYFKKGKQPREALAYVDRSGGSNPLTLVIAAANGSKLDTKAEYEKMWALQDAVEGHKGVGTVLSLPVLMAEGNRHAAAKMPSWNSLLSIMNEPKHQRVVSTFVTKDRRLAAFYLRMEEQRRDKPRVAVVNDLRTIVRRHGFNQLSSGACMSSMEHWRSW